MNPVQRLPEGSLRVLQLTDSHLYADPSRRLLGLDTLDSFDRVVQLARNLFWPPDMVLATGDLVHDASPIGYKRLQGRLESMEVPVYCLPGNHDDPRLLATLLNSDNVRSIACAVHGAWYFIFLDSTVPGKDHGHVSSQQLIHLEQCLSVYPDKHTMVCLHHQAIPTGSTWLDTMAVDNPEALFSVLDRHPQIRAVLWGHIHQNFESSRRGVRMLGSPSTCIQFLPKSEQFGLDSAPPGYRWLTLLPNGSIVTDVERMEAYPSRVEMCSSGY